MAYEISPLYRTAEHTMRAVYCDGRMYRETFATFNDARRAAEEESDCDDCSFIEVTDDVGAVKCIVTGKYA